MDIKLGVCFERKRLKDHTKEGGKVVRDFLIKEGLPEKVVEKVVNAVESHHREVPFDSLEAEIITNADCYSFLFPDNFIGHVCRNLKKGKSLEETWKFMDQKIEEKHKILSLDICKKELEPYYRTLRHYLDKAKDFC
jgi:hypothetical protein